MMYHRLKQFLHHNYLRNCEATPKTTPPPLPWVLIMGDSCIMWRKEERGETWRSVCVIHLMSFWVHLSILTPSSLSLRQVM